MKKHLLLLSTFFFFNNVSAQEVIFENDFNTQEAFNLWSTMDLDEDGAIFNYDAYAFVYNAEFEGSAAISWSIDIETGEAATPDNLLISPIITLPASSDLYFSFASFDETIYIQEKLSVYVVAADYDLTQIATATPLFMKRVDSNKREDKVIDLTPYANQKIKIVFRHHDSVDQTLLMIDDVKVISKTLATTEVDVANSFVITPNPAKENFSIEVNNAIDREAMTVEIFDLTGRKVANFNSVANEYNISSLPKGVYVVKMNDGYKTISQKLIKN